MAKTPYSISGPIPIYASFNQETGWLNFKATRKIQSNNEYQTFQFQVPNIFEIGLYEMFVPDEHFEAFTDYKDAYPCSVYYHDTLNKGVVNITYLNEEYTIISGTFEMDLVNQPSCSEQIIHITEGRFDVRY